jgi:hypothetical protein
MKNLYRAEYVREESLSDKYGYTGINGGSSLNIVAESFVEACELATAKTGKGEVLTALTLDYRTLIIK